MSTSIPVTVVTGPFGSGKTTLLNHLLKSGVTQGRVGRDHADIVVLACEAGIVPFEHGRVVQVIGNTALVPSACPCCAVQGDLVDTLRDLFMQALQRKISSFAHVLVETDGMADPASVMYTLKYDRFLGERYAYQGCIAVLDGQQGDEPLRHPEIQRQAALADVVVISKTERATREQIQALRVAVHTVNPGAACLPSTEIHDLAALIEAGTFRAGISTGPAESTLWSGRKMGPASRGALDMAVLTLAWGAPLRRSAFARVVDRLQSPSGPVMLRVQGRVWFQGTDVPSLVHGVHQQLYVMDDPEPTGAFAVVQGQPSMRPKDTQFDESLDRRSILTLVFRGVEKADFRDELLSLMPGGELIVSSGGNFMRAGIALSAM